MTPHPTRGARSAPAAPLALALLAAAANGCNDADTPMTIDADRVAAPPAADTAPPPAAAKPRRGEIRSPKDALLPDAP
jgi:hypothetical protein